MARGTYGLEGGRGERVARLSHTGGDLWNTNQPANTLAHAGAKLPWDGEALRVPTFFVSALDAVTPWALPPAEGEIRTRNSTRAFRDRSLVYNRERG